jgi:serine/threonine protein kinase
LFTFSLATLHDYIKFRNKRVAEDGNAAAGIDTKRNFEIFSQILEGTAYIHDQGLIHRDLKPSNIFLGMPTSVEGRKRRCSFNGDRLSSGKHFSSGRFGRSFDDVMSSKGLHDYMWEEYWVPKIGDFGLAADVIDEASGDPLLVPQDMSTTPPTPKLMTRSSVSTLTSVTSDDTSKKGYNDHSGLKRPKPRRTRTIGVGTRTVSRMHVIYLMLI